MRLKRHLGAAGALLFIAGSGQASEPVPTVVATIKPIHSLVAAVMDGVGEPYLLISGGASPHSYALRPSDAQALQEAAVIFWIGEGLETFLTASLGNLDGPHVVALAEADGVTLLPIREGGLWAAHSHGEDDHDHDGDAHDAAEHGDHEDHGDHVEHGDHEHGDEVTGEDHEPEDHEHGHDTDADHDHDHAAGHGETDMHVWLDPHNADSMAAAIAIALSEADPARADTYQANAQALRSRLANLDAALAGQLAPIHDRGYIVFHDAYQYFETRYGLSPVGSISISPETRPGAQRLTELRAYVEDHDAVCVFAEPQFEPAVVETIVDGTDARAGVLDPLGADIEAGPDQYFTLLEALTDDLRSCLTGQE